MTRYIIFIVSLLVLNAAKAADRVAIVFSPDNRMSFDLVTTGSNLNGSLLAYKVSYKSQEVISTSRIGFKLKVPGITLGAFKVIGESRRSVNENWEPVWGEEKSIRNNYNELILNLLGQDSIRVDLTIRIYNEGVGFRYSFPKQPRLNHFIIADELTQFNVVEDHKAFWIPGDYDTNEYGYYTSKLSEVDASGGGFSQEIHAKTFFNKNAVQTPLMMKSGKGLYINIHEAALLNYPAMNLVLDKTSFTFNTHLVPDAEGNKAYLQTPAVTPWRTVIISDKAVDILSSRMILNLNEPSVIPETSWIRPQKMVGVWWELHVGKSSWDYSGGQVGSQQATKVPHGATTENVKRYIDFASKHGIEGVLVEGWNTGWEDWFGNWKEAVFDFVTPYPDFNVAELQKYAASKGVKIIMHHETSASVTNYERQMDTAYRFMKSFGYDAVKTGYVGRIIPRGEHHDGQWMVRHYEHVLKKTAGYRIMVDMHEPVRPTGIHRTYPNFLASEAARGNEFNAWSNGNMPDHETILPFTRMMGGPMDYTPGIFKIKMSHYNPDKKEQVHTTLTKQLALYVTLYSPLQMAADLPENYEARPDAFQFIKDVAVDWDETKILDAEPGDYIIIARKAKGKESWFLGAITDEEARNIRTPMSFLDQSKKYVATIYRDGKDAHWKTNPESYQVERFIVDAKTILALQLAPGGGTAISFAPASAEEIKRLKKYKP